ncbi:MAG: amidase [Deltaproteobacteria bacterium]|nr:amidase [Deltaproteobacteria bacterium]
MAKELLGRAVGSTRRGIIPPTLEELRSIAQEYHMTMSIEDLEGFAAEIEGTLASYRRVGQLPEPRPEVKYPRVPGYRPPRDENPLNAWCWRCSIKGASRGKLAGKTIAIKDNVCVAGVPMMNGSAILEGFVPDVDATIVTRILDAGGEIIGKAVCEDLCLTGGSHTSVTGPVLNPHNPRYSAGGSSSGSAVLVVNEDCDMAIGGDQGGSIRIPSALCGAYGLKPTYGLVPYTGIFPIENTLDHTGPMARTVEDVALLLEVIAGRDPLDPRQREEIKKISYTKALTGSVRDLSFGVVREGFGWPEGSGPDVDQAVKDAAFSFEKLGAKVRELSIPLHRDGIHIFSPIFVEGAAAQMIRGNGFGTGWKGYYPTGMLNYYGKSRKMLADNFSNTVKLVILVGHYMLTRYHGRYYAKAQNQVRLLREAYDQALREVDLLVMPTVAPEGKALPLVENPTPEEYFRLGWRHHWNCAPFNITGHPAMNVPCAKSDGLPIGMMLIGRQFGDATVLRGAHAFQSLGRYG